MRRNWPLLFIIIPLMELYLIIKVGGIIGAFWTVMLVLSTAFIGVNLLRYQGMNTLARAQRSMSQGALPAMEMMEGMALAVGGAFLITPGFITDTLGFLCLIPVTRRAIIRYIMANASVRTNQGFQSGGFYSQTGRQNHSSQDGFVDDYQPKQTDSSSESSSHSSGNKPTNKVGRTLEGEYRRED